MLSRVGRDAFLRGVLRCADCVDQRTARGLRQLPARPHTFPAQAGRSRTAGWLPLVRGMKGQLMRLRRRTMVFAVASLALAAGLWALVYPRTAQAQKNSALAAKISEIANRPEYKHATFGVEVYSLDDDKVVFALRGDELFTPASTTKLLTEGTALELLGADYRFHTGVYRTGSIAGDGTLNGDLILVASGDPNLSGRIQPDGSLAFENKDHSYDGQDETRAVAGDPLLVVREIAAQVASHGVKKIQGNVLVDARLFAEGDREEGTGAVISAICVNDNLIDLTISPGEKEGSATSLKISPATSYVTFINQVTTSAPKIH